MVWSLIDPALALALAVILLIVLRRAGQRLEVWVDVNEWEHGLLYVDGRFSRLLPPGRHFNLAFHRRRTVYRLHKFDRLLDVLPADVTSLDRLVYRLGATITYEIVDPHQAFLAHDSNAHLRLAATTALIRFAAAHTLDAVLAGRAALDEKLMAEMPPALVGCIIKAATITAVVLPPEIRRMVTEVERAKLEGLAALERARGEHAALRSLANAARLLKGNPELMNLRVLQAVAPANGKRPPTLVLGQSALLPVGQGADAPDDP